MTQEKDAAPIEQQDSLAALKERFVFESSADAEPQTEENPEVEQESVEKSENVTVKTKEVETQDQSKPVKELSLEEKLEQAEKRRKDTQKWGNENNEKLQKQQKALEILFENGEITREAFEAASAEVENQLKNPMADVITNFNQRYPVLKSFLEQQGETPDEYVKAFDRMAVFEPDIQEELKGLDAEKQPAFILAKGKELLDSYKLLENSGSFSSAIKAAKEQAVEDYKASLKEATKEVTKPKEKPSLRAKPDNSTGTPTFANDQAYFKHAFGGR